MSVEPSKRDSDLGGLEQRLLRATVAGDQAAQMRLYRLAGEHHLRLGNIDQGCFYLTNAWVLSLALGDVSEQELRQKLARHGRV